MFDLLTTIRFHFLKQWIACSINIDIAPDSLVL